MQWWILPVRIVSESEKRKGPVMIWDSLALIYITSTISHMYTPTDWIMHQQHKWFFLEEGACSLCMHSAYDGFAAF